MRQVGHEGRLHFLPQRLIQELTRRIEAPLVIDADGLNAHAGAIEKLADRRGPFVLTPHAGEMAQLLGMERDAVEADPDDAARRAAAAFGATVALKGPETVIAAPDGAIFRYTRGGAGLGTSGSGDVLAGIVAGLLARGADPLRAAAWGVFLHGEAGNALARRHGAVGLLAREIAAEIPRILHRTQFTRRFQQACRIAEVPVIPFHDLPTRSPPGSPLRAFRCGPSRSSSDTLISRRRRSTRTMRPPSTRWT